MITAFNVAEYFLKISVPSSPYSITPLKLQKLLYFAQGWHLAKLGKPLFKEEIKAWKHGPVIRNIYETYKSYGYYTIDPSRERLEKNIEKMYEKDSLDVLKFVWDRYGGYDGKFLEELVFQEDPLLFTDNGEIIEVELMKKWFEQEKIKER